MVRIHPDPPLQATGNRQQATGNRQQATGNRQQATGGIGAVAQLGEHLLCKQGVVGSIPISSTRLRVGTGRLPALGWPGDLSVAGAVLSCLLSARRCGRPRVESSELECSLTIGKVRVHRA